MSFAYKVDGSNNASTWVTTLSSLYNQKDYLEDLLSKTATTLNALRDKQSRNVRALKSNPGPRAKKKRITQCKWRTGKTIKTCENEERIILKCLEVCYNNISIFEALMEPSHCSSSIPDTVTTYSTRSDVATDSVFDWNGWWDDDGVSPFMKECQYIATGYEDIAPEMLFEDHSPQNLGFEKLKEPSSHVQILDTAATPYAPPNTADQPQGSLLSPEAAVFEPSVLQRAEPDDFDEAPELDKLTIPDLLSSKLYMKIQARRCSDAAVDYMFRRLPGAETLRTHMTAQHSKYASWSPDASVYKGNADEGMPDFQALLAERNKDE